MDPQQRLLLEYAYLAFHDAGYTKETLQGLRAGVFVGIQNSDLAELNVVNGSNTGLYSTSGTSHSVAAGRLSFVFGLHGKFRNQRHSTHQASPIAHRSPLTAHRSPLTAHRSPLTTYHRTPRTEQH